MTVEEVNALSDSAFIAAFGGLYEHSPWIAERTEPTRPFTDLNDMADHMTSVVTSASEREQFDLLRAHPELAGKAAIDGALTEASATEQASAGLDRMHPEEFETLTKLNAAYRKKHDFPFIICVRENTKSSILAKLRARLEHPTALEFETALKEVAKIVRLRLEGIVT